MFLYAIYLALLLQAWLTASLKIHPDLVDPNAETVGVITRPHEQEIIQADTIYTVQWASSSADGGPFRINLWGAPDNEPLQTIGTDIDYLKGEFQWPIHLEQYATLYFITIDDGVGSVRDKSGVFSISSPLIKSPARIPFQSDVNAATTMTTSVVRTSPDRLVFSTMAPISPQDDSVTSLPITVPSNLPTDESLPTMTFSMVWSRTEGPSDDIPSTIPKPSTHSSGHAYSAWRVGMIVGLVMVCLLWATSLVLAYLIYRRNRGVERRGRHTSRASVNIEPEPAPEEPPTEEPPARAEAAAPKDDVGVATVIQLRRISFKEPEAGSQSKRASVTFVE